MKKVSLTSKIVSAVMNFIVLLLIFSKWLSITVNFGGQNRFSLFEISSILANLRLFESLEVAVMSLVLSFAALVMIVLTVISIIYVLVPERNSFKFNTVAAAINCAFAVAFVVATAVLNFEFANLVRSESFFSINIPSVFMPTAAPFVVIVLSILSRVILVKREHTQKALPVPFENSANGEKSTKTCGECGAQCDCDAQFCNICGHKFDGAKYVCPNCGKVAAPTAVFCKYCGQRLDNVDEANAGEENVTGDNIEENTIEENVTEENVTYNEENVKDDENN